MAIRIRRVDGHVVALCAARSVEKPGDLYLDDAVHMALSRKYWMDYPEMGPTPEPWVVELTEREESNNPNREWWDREYGTESQEPPK